MWLKLKNGPFYDYKNDHQNLKRKNLKRKLKNTKMKFSMYHWKEKPYKKVYSKGPFITFYVFIKSNKGKNNE